MATREPSKNSYKFWAIYWGVSALGLLGITFFGGTLGLSLAMTLVLLLWALALHAALNTATMLRFPYAVLTRRTLRAFRKLVPADDAKRNPPMGRRWDRFVW